MKYEDLNCRQKEVIKVVLERDCIILVLGGAGTGKTTNALWCARVLFEQLTDCPKPRVLFLTFSRAAISQIMRRCPGVIAEYESNVEIMTFHALAYRLIRSFGRYAGYGSSPLSIQSEARKKLLGPITGQLSYRDLLPGAIRLLGNHKIHKLMSSRWQLIICDEVQDTNEEQWNLLQILSPCKLLLLGDAHQMIYSGFIPGVSAERFSQIGASAEYVIELQPVSYRDPSGVIPALAEAVRTRRFDDPAVLEAIGKGRLTVIRASNESDIPGLIQDQIAHNARKEIGIFAHSNAAVAEIADQLSECGIEHVLVGIPEAHAQALSAMSIQCGFAVGLADSKDVRTALAIYLTATVRGRVPELAHALIGRFSLPGEIEKAIDQLETALRAIADESIGELAMVVMRSWPSLLITRGLKSWQRAASHFRRLTYPFRNDQVSAVTVTRLNEVIESSRVEALIDLDYSERGRIRLMNYHQTKGREADIVIHIFRNDDYFGDDQEPFEELSCLLNVALSRARERVIVILPPNPHPLVEPFGTLIEDI